MLYLHRNILYMDEVSNFIAISYGTRNSSSSIMCALVIVGFVVFCIITMKNTKKKIFYTETPTYLDITNVMNHSLDSVLDVAVGNMVDASYNNAYQTNLGTLNDYKTKNASSIMNILTNKQASNDSDTKDYDKLNSMLSSMSGVTTKLTTLQNANISALETLYTGYQTKIQGFVTNLVGMLTKINSQITTLSTSDKYIPLITPLSKIFTSIRNTLVTNSSVINQFYTKSNPFNSSALPVLGTLPVVPAVTNTSPDIFRKSGF